MAVSGIYGYNSYSNYGDYELMNLVKKSKTSSSTAADAINSILSGGGSSKTSSASSSVSSSSKTNVQDFLNNYQSALKDIESASSKLAESNRKGVFNDYQAASSNEQVATVSRNYTLKGDTEIQLDVESLAQAQVSSSEAYGAQETVEAGADMEFQINGSDGAAVADVSVSSTNEDGTAKTYDQMYQEAAQAINAQRDSGVRASVSNVDGNVSLTLSSTRAGEDNGFTISGNTGAAGGIETAEVEAQDAVYTVTQNGSSQTYSSDSNTISLERGRIDAELKNTGESTIYTGVDADEIVSAVEDLVGAYNEAVSLASENTGSGTSSYATSSRRLADEKTLAALGITYDQDRNLTVDKETLMNALQTDYEGTKSMLGGQLGIAQAAESNAGKALSDSVEQIINNSATSSSASSSSSSTSDTTQANENSPYRDLSNFVRSGPYNMSNYYAVGMLLNTFG